jgi:hypothetical protein
MGQRRSIAFTANPSEFVTLTVSQGRRYTDRLVHRLRREKAQIEDDVAGEILSSLYTQIENADEAKAHDLLDALVPFWNAQTQTNRSARQMTLDQYLEYRVVDVGHL